MRLGYRAVTIAVLAAGLVPAAGAVASASAARSSVSHATTSAGTRLAADSAPGGTRLWVARYNGGAGRIAAAASVAVNPIHPIVYVTGETVQAGGTAGDVTTVAYSTITGAQLWVARYQGGPRHFAGGLVTVSRDGSRVYVAASERVRQTPVFVFAYNAVTGATIWTGNDNYNADLSALAVSPNGREVFVAATPIYVGDRSYHVFAFAAMGGSLLWSSGTAFSPRPVVQAMGVSPDSSTVFVTGENGTVAYSAATGTQLWEAHYKSRWRQSMNSLTVSPDGSAVFVTGHTGTPPGTFQKYLTIAYNATTGTRLWQARYFDGTSGTAGAFSVAVSPDSSTVFVTGSASKALNSDDATTIAYNATTGARLWVARYPNPAGTGSYSEGRVVMVSPDGSKVFVAGIVSPRNCCAQQGFAVAGYDAATGARLWTASYGGTGQFNDLASAVLSRNGDRLVLAGTADAISNTPEFLTAAFHT